MSVQTLCMFGVILILLVTQCSARGDFEDFDHDEKAISPERIAQFYTETLIQSAGKEEQRCSEAVFRAREKYSKHGKKRSLGVEPTVGLGSALLIFLGVGIFAVGIAQAFQMVSALIDLADFPSQISAQHFSLYAMKTLKNEA